VSRSSEILAITYAARHCSEYGCLKCARRARWERRKRSRSPKNPIRRDTRRK
jgi:hypothetical protein